MKPETIDALYAKAYQEGYRECYERMTLDDGVSKTEEETLDEFIVVIRWISLVGVSFVVGVVIGKLLLS